MISSTRTELKKLDTRIRKTKTALDTLAEQLKTTRTFSEYNELERLRTYKLRQLQQLRELRNTILATAEVREDKDAVAIYGGSHNRHYQPSLAISER